MPKTYNILIMAKRKATKNIEVVGPEIVYVLKKDWNTSKYGLLKKGDTIQETNEKVINYLKENKYL